MLYNFGFEIFNTVKKIISPTCEKRILNFNQIREWVLSDHGDVVAAVDILMKSFDSFQDSGKVSVYLIDLLVMLFGHCRNDFRDTLSQPALINKLLQIAINLLHDSNIVCRKLIWFIKVGNFDLKGYY